MYVVYLYIYILVGVCLYGCMCACVLVHACCVLVCICSGACVFVCVCMCGCTCVHVCLVGSNYHPAERSLKPVLRMDSVERELGREETGLIAEIH